MHIYNKYVVEVVAGAGIFLKVSKRTMFLFVKLYASNYWGTVT